MFPQQKYVGKTGNDFLLSIKSFLCIFLLKATATLNHFLLLGMRASVHIDLPGWTKEGLPALKKRCEELALQPRGTRGESGGQTGKTKFPYEGIN